MFSSLIRHECANVCILPLQYIPAVDGIVIYAPIKTVFQEAMCVMGKVIVATTQMKRTAPVSTDPWYALCIYCTSISSHVKVLKQSLDWWDFC